MVFLEDGAPAECYSIAIVQVADRWECRLIGYAGPGWRRLYRHLGLEGTPASVHQDRGHTWSTKRGTWQRVAVVITEHSRALNSAADATRPAQQGMMPLG